MKYLRMKYTDARNQFFSASVGVRPKGYDYTPSMLLCREALRQILFLPDGVREIVLVPLKRATADTVKIERHESRYGELRMIADGKLYSMNIEMCAYFHMWIDAGYSHIRFEY